MPETIIQKLKQKATLLNQLSRDESALFEYINTNHDNLEEVIQQYKPEREFKPVNTLHFLIAKELKKESLITKAFIAQLKKALEDRDVSEYYDMNDSVKQSLTNYKDSKIGMFPNWKHTFKILFPFIHKASENEEVKDQLNQLADKIIEANQLENVTKHIVSFQGAQNYGTDIVWLAIIPESAPSVQYTYQIFLRIDVDGLSGGIHKGHNLTKREYDNQDLPFNSWENYIKHTQQTKTEWTQLNSEINFIFLNDEKAFVKTIKKVDTNSLARYFNILDRFKEELDIQDEEKLVFSLAKNRLSFQVGKRYCLNVSKGLFDFISNADLEGDNSNRETFSGTGSTYLYKSRKFDGVLSNYEDIKSAVENEIERENHTEAKFYDNSAFRKAVFDKEYRNKFIQNNAIPSNKRKYWALGFNSNSERLKLFKNEGYWQALDYAKDDPRNAAKRARKLFNQIQTNDYIVIKGYGGSHDLIVHFKAKVLSKDDENERLELARIEGSLYKGKAPSGSGAGNWHETILQVKRDEDIKLLFGEDMENLKEKFIDWYIANPKSSYFNNDRDKIDEYLVRSLDSFSKDIFFVNSSNYRAIINFINETINTNKTKFLKNHGAIDSGKLAAIVGKKNYQKFLREYFKDDIDSSIDTIQSEYRAPLNQIFYGPPGTGKTYNTILEAAKIINQNDALNYSEAQTIFNENLRDKIEFITFHQNYSYEDFIQGLRPDIEQKALSFNRADGIFTKMVTNALFEYYKVYQKNQKAIVSKENSKIDLNDAFIEFLNSLEEGQEFETKTGSEIKVDNFTEKQNIEFRPLNGVKSYLVSGTRLLKLYDVFDDIDKIKRVHEDIRDAIGGCNSSIYYVALREFIEFLNIYKATATEFEDEDDAIDYDNITYRRKKELLSSVNSDDLRTVSEHAVHKYVIIIDEINRANISRVFGELITLIEKDKRSHGKIPLSATLPSGEQFIVPSNLHIIGTMNTADKSIALLDIALRRRFEFKAMYPKYEIEDVTIHKAEFLKKLNDLIVASGKGHDFTIGHSYFMDESDTVFNFESTINNKVIPLLLEYYMNDEVEVSKILNEALKEHNYKIANWPLEIVKNGN